MWDLPGQGIKPVSPTLAGRFFTTEPLYHLKPLPCISNWFSLFFLAYSLHHQDYSFITVHWVEFPFLQYLSKALVSLETCACQLHPGDLSPGFSPHKHLWFHLTSPAPHSCFLSFPSVSTDTSLWRLWIYLSAPFLLDKNTHQLKQPLKVHECTSST